MAGEFLDAEAVKALVTGSGGFVGSHLVRVLQAIGHDVIEADIKQGVDLADLATARRCLAQKPDVVFHLASTCSTPGSVKDPTGTFTNTVVVAANVLEAARPDKVPLVITSSVKARDGQTPYGAAKCMVETWAREYRAAYGMQIVINRPGTIYGPGQEGSDESGWISWFCRAKAENLEVTINGDGEQVRDLLHVLDYVRLMRIQARHIETYDGRTWDVGGGEENRVTVNQIASHLGLQVVHGPSRYGDSREYVGYNNVPGWEPQIRWWEDETLR